MAKATILTDDMDGTPGATERFFSIGGSDYSIDLNDDNYSAMLKTMEPWRSLASVAKKRRRTTHAPLTKEERIQIRQWAATNGKTLAARGRFPDDLVQEYFASQDVAISDALSEEEFGSYPGPYHSEYVNT